MAYFRGQLELRVWSGEGMMAKSVLRHDIELAAVAG